MAYATCDGYYPDPYWGEGIESDSWDHYDGLASADPYSDNCNYYMTSTWSLCTRPDNINYVYEYELTNRDVAYGSNSRCFTGDFYLSSSEDGPWYGGYASCHEIQV